MFVSSSIHANHADLIHDVAYDFYGRRMATCSSDQMIKVRVYCFRKYLWYAKFIILLGLYYEAGF